MHAAGSAADVTAQGVAHQRPQIAALAGHREQIAALGQIAVLDVAVTGARIDLHPHRRPRVAGGVQVVGDTGIAVDRHPAAVGQKPERWPARRGRTTNVRAGLIRIEYLVRDRGHDVALAGVLVTGTLEHRKRRVRKPGRGHVRLRFES